MKENRLKYSVKVVHQCGKYYKQGHSLKETAAYFNIPYQWVKVNLLRYGYRQPSKILKHQLHPPINYFSKIDSHTKAYLLGWIFSDGYVCKNPYGFTLGIALQAQDKYILDFMAQELDIPISKIKKYKNSYKLCVNERTICKDLINLGIEEDKSHKEIHIPEIPKEFHSSFIAGIFDGDGCITQKTAYNYVVVSICSNSKIFLSEIKTILNNNGIQTREVQQHKLNLCTLYISSNSRSKFAEFIYSNTPIKLIRKYNKFMKIPR